MSKRIKLYLDEDAQSTDLIQALRARHIDVVTVSEVNLLGEADDVHLQYATEQGRVIFTFNRGDFFRLHTEWLSNEQHHSGFTSHSGFIKQNPPDKTNFGVLSSICAG